MIYYAILAGMTLIGAIASLFLKGASASDNIMKMLVNINLYIGGGLYVLSAILNIFVLRYMDYSIVLPLTSITYIWTMVLSRFILKEKITIKKMAGTILIIVGAVFISI